MAHKSVFRPPLHLLPLLLVALLASSLFSVSFAAPVGAGLSLDVRSASGPADYNDLVKRAPPATGPRRGGPGKNLKGGERVPDDATKVGELVKYLLELIDSNRLDPAEIYFWSSPAGEVRAKNAQGNDLPSKGETMAKNMAAHRRSQGKKAGYFRDIFGDRFKNKFGVNTIDSEINKAASVAIGKVQTEVNIYRALNPAEDSYWEVHELPQVEAKIDAKIKGVSKKIYHLRDDTLDKNDYIATQDSEGNITPKRRSPTPPNVAPPLTVQPPTGSVYVGSGWYSVGDGIHWKGNKYYWKNSQTGQELSSSTKPVVQRVATTPITPVSGPPSGWYTYPDQQGRSTQLYYDANRQKWYVKHGNQLIQVSAPTARRNCKRAGGACAAGSKDPVQGGQTTPKPAVEQFDNADDWMVATEEATDSFVTEAVNHIEPTEPKTKPKAVNSGDPKVPDTPTEPKGPGEPSTGPGKTNPKKPGTVKPPPTVPPPTIGA